MLDAIKEQRYISVISSSEETGAAEPGMFAVILVFLLTLLCDTSIWTIAAWGTRGVE